MSAGQAPSRRSTSFGGCHILWETNDDSEMPESDTLHLTSVDPYERIALAVREALPGSAGERLLARIVDELAAVD